MPVVVTLSKLIVPPDVVRLPRAVEPPTALLSVVIPVLLSVKFVDPSTIPLKVMAPDPVDMLVLVPDRTAVCEIAKVPLEVVV